MKKEILLRNDFMNSLPGFSSSIDIEKKYRELSGKRTSPLIILDDDPTGIQTIHGLNVYMSWDQEVFKEIFAKNEIAFIHTNTRAYPQSKVRIILKEIMTNILHVAKNNNSTFEIISRSDSTLRGHYPFETEYIRNFIEKETDEKIDGEILVPFFKEGGRVTFKDIHYVLDEQNIIPADQTEFAKDPDFSFNNSDLKLYIEEKTHGKHSASSVISIPLDILRKGNHSEIKKKLLGAKNFSRIIVNAVEYDDLKAFIPSLMEARKKGKHFIYRTAASFVKTYTFNDDIELLSRSDFPAFKNTNDTILLIAGSYTEKTSLQLDQLKLSFPVESLELKVRELLKDDLSFEAETRRATGEIASVLRSGKNPVLFTSRKLVNSDDHLKTAERISHALVKIIQDLDQRPGAIIAKGGITSSVLAVNGLKIRKAQVKGQILPGVPVVETGDESKWPGLSYIIFPGNVGNKESLMELYSKLLW